MTRGTTPVYTLTVSGFNLTEYTCYVTITANRSITLTGERLTVTYADGASTIAFELTKAETLALRQGAAMLQLRVVNADGTALASGIARVTIQPVLLEREIKYVPVEVSE